MKVQVLGCSHHDTPISVRERFAFSAEQVCSALEGFRREFPNVEAVLLSTCNRVELYTATQNDAVLTSGQLTSFLARFHHMDPAEMMEHLCERAGREAVYHLFLVSSSLDSMVVGEPQILSQVKTAYRQATKQQSAGPLTHSVFQAALRVARRVAGETSIHQHRVSIPSVAVADFARQIFDRFDDKTTMLIGAGEMAEETLKYLKGEGAEEVIVVNRNAGRAMEVARRWNGRALQWERLLDTLAVADLVISTTGAMEPIVSLEDYVKIEPSRQERPLFILDLAVPRDFDAAIGDRPGVYLYSVDDLRASCEQNRRRRDKELPAALRIIEREADRFMAELHHRATSPIIKRLREGWQRPKEAELQRLMNKLPGLDERTQSEISQSFDRLVNKLLHPPLESLREESRHGIPSALVDALTKLFQLKD